MKSNIKMSKVVLFIITIVLLLSLAVDVRADDGNVMLLTTNNSANNTTNNTVNNTTNNTVNNTTNNTNNTSRVNTTNKTNTSSYVNNSSNLPKTGAEDYTIVFIILGVCVISAIYAYKKSNDYKSF